MKTLLEVKDIFITIVSYIFLAILAILSFILVFNLKFLAEVFAILGMEDQSREIKNWANVFDWSIHWR